MQQDDTLSLEEEVRGQHFQMGDISPFRFGRNSKVYFSFIGSIVNTTSLWMDPLFDLEDLVNITSNFPTDRAVLPGAKSRAPPEIGQADLVIAGTGAWDTSFTNRFDAFEQVLPQWRDTLLGAYPNTPLVLRLNNGFCCRGTDVYFRRFTGGRVQHFDDLLREASRVEGGKAMEGRISVLDPSYMSGRPEVVLDFGSPGSNHPRASHTRIEMQMMLNSVCERDASGKARFRWKKGHKASQGAHSLEEAAQDR